MTDEIIVQEVDQFNNLMHPQTDDDNYYMLEQRYLEITIRPTNRLFGLVQEMLINLVKDMVQDIFLK